jgi:hypothetical protein
MSTIQDKTAQIRVLLDEIDAQAGTTPPPSTRHCHFGYFGDNPTIVVETKDHSDLAWPNGWPTGTTALDVCKQAKAAGMKIMLPVWGAAPPDKLASNLEYFLQQCDQAHILDAVVAIYPLDEPDVAGWSATQVKTMCDTVRKVADKFPAIADAPLAAFYGQQGTAGISSFDWIGKDNYGNGPQILPLEPYQKLMLIAGGTNDWKESPDQFVAYAQAHSEVVAVIGFMWVWPSKPENQAIKGNGMAPAYRAAGKTLTGK